MRKIYIIVAVTLLNFGYLFAQQMTACDLAIERGRAQLNAGRYTDARETFVQANEIAGCTEAQRWIEETDRRIRLRNQRIQDERNRVTEPTPPTEQELALQSGIERYNAGSLGEARISFARAMDLGCTEATNWLNRVAVREQEERCRRHMARGESYFHRGEYAIALREFRLAAQNNCPGADVLAQNSQARLEEEYARRNQPVVAQRRQNALGFKIPGGLSYQRMLNDVNRLELNLRLGSPLNFSGLYQWVFDIDSNWKWYVGVGCGLGMRRYTIDNERSSEFFLNLLGNIGIEYSFEEPFQVALEYTPALNIVSNFGNFGGGIRLAIRWLF